MWAHLTPPWIVSLHTPVKGCAVLLVTASVLLEVTDCRPDDVAAGGVETAAEAGCPVALDCGADDGAVEDVRTGADGLAVVDWVVDVLAVVVAVVAALLRVVTAVEPEAAERINTVSDAEVSCRWQIQSSCHRSLAQTRFLWLPSASPPPPPRTHTHFKMAALKHRKRYHAAFHWTN